jgi:predicted ATP-grasp superfamily ATP-dependent carboligase
VLNNNRTTPVLILGGQTNALAVARAFGRKNIPVYISAYTLCHAQFSKFCIDAYLCDPKMSIVDYWYHLLFKKRPTVLQNAFIFPCCDEALAFMSVNKEKIIKSYKTYEYDSFLVKQLLNKQQTLDLAIQAGVPAPKYWHVNSASDLKEIQDLTFPVMIKPKYTYVFIKAFQVKLVTADNWVELKKWIKKILPLKIEVMLCEIIPGPDTLLSSYYTYITPDGNNLFKYTKRVIRRKPINYGGGCYHISKWEPGTAEMGEKFFRFIKLNGLANVEFKYDTRDKKLKIIECNMRLTAAHQLLIKSHYDIGYAIYAYHNNLNYSLQEPFLENTRLWYPFEDIRAFIELNKLGQITVLEWIRSITCSKIVLPYFDIYDLKPALSRYRMIIDKILGLCKS